MTEWWSRAALSDNRAAAVAGDGVIAPLRHLAGKREVDGLGITVTPGRRRGPAPRAGGADVVPARRWSYRIRSWTAVDRPMRSRRG